MNESGNKYQRTITGLDGKATIVDVYNVLEAFGVTCPARQHAIKKLLCAGLRGKGSSVSDLQETVDAVHRSVQLETQRQPELNTPKDAFDEFKRGGFA